MKKFVKARAMLVTVPLALMAVVGTVTPASAAKGKDPGPTPTPSPVAASLCATESLSLAKNIIEIGSGTPLTVTANLSSCANVDEAIEVDYLVISPNIFDLSCNMAPWAATDITLKSRDTNKGVTSSRPAPTCAGNYNLVGVVRSGSTLLAVSQTIFSMVPKGANSGTGSI
jgi:hypothetical protein